MKDCISFKQALNYWLKLGFISFGGPAGQIAIMHQDLVEKRKWISEQQFIHALNFCMLLPGPEATVSDLYRLADAWQIGRHRRRHLIYITGAITDVGTGLRLYDVWQATTSPIHIVGH
jgi:hypothetical protein